MDEPNIAVIGVGEGGEESLTPQAKRLVAQADIIYGGERHVERLASIIQVPTVVWGGNLYAKLEAIAKERDRRIVILASGDPFLYGVGSVLTRYVAPRDMHVIPAPSAASWACAQLGWAFQGVRVLSLCGRPISRLTPHLQPSARLLVFSADEHTPNRLAEWLTERGFGPSALYVLERLGGAHARQRHLRASDAPFTDIARLNMIGIDVRVTSDARIIALSSGLPDSFFAHDGQITKREIRAITLSSLAPRQGETLWDFGAGSGSISIEWLLRHPQNRAYAIEREAERLERIRLNADALGVPDINVLQADLPCDLSHLPRPDAVFVGGGAGRDGVLDLAWNALKVGGRLVANAVTLESEAQLMASFQDRGGTLSRLHIERLSPVGRLRGFRPAMTVTQYVVVKS